MQDGCTPWPEEVAARYREAGYWRGEVLGDLIARPLRDTPTRIAIVAPGGTITYAALDARAARVAGALQAIGVGQGDRVVLQLPNSIDFAAVSLALFRIGVMPVFALPAHRRHEIAYLCAHADAAAYIMPGVFQGFDYRALGEEVRAAAPQLRHVISTGETGAGQLALATLIERAPPPVYPTVDPGEVGFFLLSGGTTGTPKLIPRTHQDYRYQLRETAASLGVTGDSVYLAALPAAHNAALGCPGVLGTLAAGGRVVMAATPSPDEVFPLIAREGVTLTTLMPALLKLWIDVSAFMPVDLSRVLFEVGGSWLDPEVARAVSQKLHARLSHWFGMAEGFLCHTRLTDPEDVVVSSCGHPLCPADEVRIVNESDQDVGPGEQGEMLVRGPYTLRGYYRADDYNRQVFTTDGFLRTGDLVRRTPRGDLMVSGRIKDVVNRGGEKVPVEELEQQLVAHPAVLQAAVVARPDPALVEKTCAFVVTSTPRPSLIELRQFLRDAGLADFKLPDYVEYVDALPYTSLGKVNKRLLRERVVASGGRS